jgi:hypothetical protein
MGGLDLVLHELQEIRRELRTENMRAMHIDTAEPQLSSELFKRAVAEGVIEQKKRMVGVFSRFYNHQGELRWKCVCVYAFSIEHTEVVRTLYPTVAVACNIKHAPKIGTFCKPPAHYMRGI